MLIWTLFLGQCYIQREFREFLTNQKLPLYQKNKTKRRVPLTIHESWHNKRNSNCDAFLNFFSL